MEKNHENANGSSVFSFFAFKANQRTCFKTSKVVFTWRFPILQFPSSIFLEANFNHQVEVIDKPPTHQPTQGLAEKLEKDKKRWSWGFPKKNMKKASKDVFLVKFFHDQKHDQNPLLWCFFRKGNPLILGKSGLVNFV